MSSNILLVILDSVRARNVSFGGYANDTTPFCSEFADRATTYTQARSPGAKSLTSHTSIFTGLSVEQHNITSADDRLDSRFSIFERLRSENYTTGVFSENTWLTDVNVGLKDGFDTIEGPRNLPFPAAVDPKSFVAEEGRGQYVEYLKKSFTESSSAQSILNGLATKLAWDYPWLLPDSLQVSTAADIYADLFLDWERKQSGPWAACINFMDAHIPYEPDEEFDRWGGSDAREIQDGLRDLKWVFLGGQEPWWKRRALEGLYDGAIAQMDAQLRRIVNTLDERGVLDDTFVVITSDHGEGFGEYSDIRSTRVAEHGVAIDDAITHVPLLVKYPGQTESETVTEPATLTRFPEATRAVVEDEAGPEIFVPEGPVVVSAVGLNGALKTRAADYIDDLKPFTATARAVVTLEDGRIFKDITWRNQSRRMEVIDSQTSYTVGAPPKSVHSKIKESFDDMENLDVRTKGSGVEGASDATRKRLKDLGYI